eukprot:99783-Amphidinium_carterae.1
MDELRVMRVQLMGASRPLCATAKHFSTIGTSLGDGWHPRDQKDLVREQAIRRQKKHPKESYTKDFF